MKKGFKLFAVVLALVLVITGIIGLTATKTTTTTYAAEYSYDSNRDGFTYDGENLVVTFTVTEPTPGSTYNWIVYLFSSSTQADFNYNSDHKYYDSVTMGRDVASYYFVTGNNTSTGTITVTIPADAPAYSGGPQEAVSQTDYLNHATGLTLTDVIDTNNWYISVGPLWASAWSSTGYSYNVDYFVARGSEVIASAPAVFTFNTNGGTAIAPQKIVKGNTAIRPADPMKYAYVFDGWYANEGLTTPFSFDTVINSNTTIYAKWENAEEIVYDAELEFTVETDTDEIVFSSTTAVETPRTFTVTYTVTANDGVNSLILIPEYNKDVFTITNITAYDGTTLGTATITDDYVNNLDILKILYENAGENTLFNTTGDIMLTLTFTTNQGLTSEDNGDYTFSLVKNYYVTPGDKSIAYVILGEENNGEQKEVKITTIDTVVTVIVQEEGIVEIINDVIVYNGSPAQVTLIADADVELYTAFTYTVVGDGTVTYAFYSDEECENLITGNPVGPIGCYLKVVLATGTYYTGDTAVKYVQIIKKDITVTIDDKSGDYGEAIKPLTHSYTGDTLCGEDTVADLNIVLSTTATSSSSVGTYPITGTSNSSKYNVIFVDGTYTINAKAITITALNQTASYTGEEPEVDQTKYTVTNDIVLAGTVVITKAEGVNVGNYTLTPSYTNANYNITFVPGVFSITSVGRDAEYIASFFDGKEVIYNAQNQDLLVVDNSTPAWILNNYSAPLRTQLHADEYLISVTVTLDAQTASNYTNGTTSFNFTVESEILPYEMTITADNKSSVYGNVPATLTPTTVDGLGEDVINVTFTVEHNEEEITLSASTPVGTYDIIPDASNSDYDFTFVNGVYTITKGTPVITVTASDVSYNRALSYEVTVTVGTLTINNYTLSVEDENENVVNMASVLDAGDYTLIVTVAGTDNYYSATDSDEFAINKIALKTPTITYDASTATWTAVTSDTGDVVLYNSTVAYTINGTAVDGLSYTAISTDALTLTITPSNTNYNAIDVELRSVYTVTFTDLLDSHPVTQVLASNMPAVRYLFNGEAVTEPVEIPTVAGYTFDEWVILSDLEYVAYPFDNTSVATSNIVLYTSWEINTINITLKYTEDAETEGTDLFILELPYGSAITYTNEIEPVKSAPAGIRYDFNNTWTMNETVYTVVELTIQGVTATQPMTFVACYDTVYLPFTVTLYVSVDGGAYEQYGNTLEFDYMENIVVADLVNTINWFRADSWYGNEARTEGVPAKMPAHNISLYGAIVFDIGYGDINADGSVTTDDITLYRQWIVGGYEMEPVALNEEYATASDEDFDAEYTRYLLMKVADINKDGARDIRDISITRMSIVGGYAWDIITGETVTGDSILRNITATSLTLVDSGLRNGGRATLYNDITDTEHDLDVTVSGNIVLNLNGKTLTVKALNIVSTGTNSTITIENGTIVTTEGITISAPNGNVVITDVTGYDANGEINLQAASSSLHINGVVEFREGDTEESAPAEVKIEKDTHIVIEEAANIIVEKLVVTENFVPVVAEDVIISIDNYSIVATEIEIEGNYVDNSEISTLAELVAAAQNGGSYTLVANIASPRDIVFTHDTIIDLNGHDITFAGWGIEVTGDVSLTINGNGNVSSVEATLLASHGATLIVNGGTYSATDNFVVGTPGNSGFGGNTITINAGTFNGSITTNGYVACGIYVANNDTVTVNGGTFNITNGVGILARSGNTTIGEDVVITTTGNGTLGKVGDSQVTVPAGAVIVLDKAANYPGGTPTLTNETEYDVYTKEGVRTLSELAELRTTGGDITLLNNISFGGILTFTADTTLHLNGKTLRSTNNSALYANNGATLTIDGNGTVMAQEACVMAFNGSTIVINGGTYTTVDNFVFGTNGTEGQGGNTITINAGTFNGNISSTGYVACGIYVANNDTVTVNGGTFNITNGVGILARSGNTTIGANVVINATGNGTLGKVGDSKVTVPSGEKIVLDKAANYPGGTPTLTNNTSYTVFTKEGVRTAADLNSVRTTGGDITLLDNISYNGILVFTADATLHLNGKTLRSVNDSAIYVNNGATLTIDGTGSVMAQEACVMAFNGSSFVINGGTYTTVDNFVFGTNGTEGQGGNTITINAGTFNGNITTAGYVACGIYVANNDTVVVNGGTFNITNGVGILARSGNTTIGADVVINTTGNGTLGKVGDSKVTVPAGEKIVFDKAANYPGGTPTLTNNTEYTVYTKEGVRTVSELNAVRTTGGDITLLDNISFNGTLTFTADATLHLNGKTLRSVNSSALYVTDGATLTIDGNGSVVAQEACVMAFSGSTIVINGGTYTAIDNFVFGTNGTSGQGGNTITINAGTFNGGITSNGYVACGIYVANNDTVTVNGGTFNITNGVGILARSGNTTIGANAVINATGDGTLGKVGDSKVTVPAGEKIVLDLAANYPGGVPTLTNNGSYTVYTVE